MFVLPAHNASDWTGPSGNNTYLLPGACAALVDAGVGHPAHVSSIERALNGSPLESVLITHGHPDHLAGVPALVERWPDLRVSKMRPNLPDDVVPLSDGERVDAGNGTLVVVATQDTRRITVASSRNRLAISTAGISFASAERS